jgi:putative spermidine/putrescine transport system permease protein
LLALLYRSATALAFAGIVAPMLIVVVASFNDVRYFSFPPTGFSTLAYRQFWANAPLKNGLLTSLKIAAFATLLTILITAPAAYAIDRFRFSGRRAVELLLMTPLILPQIVIAVALLVFLSTLAVPRNAATLVGAHVLISIPFALRILLSALAGFDRHLEEASANLGARPLQTVWRVTLPVLQPGILTASVIAFVTSFGNTTVSIFLAGPATGTTLPVAIFTAAESESDVSLLAVSVVVITISLLGVAVLDKFTALERVF